MSDDSEVQSAAEEFRIRDPLTGKEWGPLTDEEWHRVLTRRPMRFWGTIDTPESIRDFVRITGVV